MSAARLAFDSLLRDHIAPLMCAEGFRKQAQTFWTRSDGTWGLINFQNSGWNSADRVSFYVNVAVASDRLLPARANRSRPPSERDAAVRTRLEGLMADDFPSQWTLRTWSDIDPIAAALELALAEVAIPFVRSFQNDDAILSYWTERLKRGEPSDTLMPLPAVVELASAAGRAALARSAQAVIDEATAGSADKPQLVVIECAKRIQPEA